jgi:hypothetical protein
MEKAPGIHLRGRCVGPKAGLDVVEKQKSLTLHDSTFYLLIVQLEAPCHTDCATMALLSLMYISKLQWCYDYLKKQP